MSDPLPVIVNAASGAQRNSRFSIDLADHFEAAGVAADIRMVEPGDLVQEVRRALRPAPEIIVVGGGDGSISAAAALLVGTSTSLGILPLGTLNHFAKDLHIPLDLAGAVATIAGGGRRRVDVGSVNERTFLNNSSLGLYPRVVAGRDTMRQRLGRGKWPALVWAALSVFRRYPFLTVRIEADRKVLVRRTPFVFVGNNRYEMEGFAIGERAGLDEGVLSLYLVNRTGRLGLLRLALRALLKRLKQAKDFDVAFAPSLLVETAHRSLRVANDGELCDLQTPLQYRILLAALSVVVPRP